MTATILTASPSWYCSRVLDSNKYGVTCYGAKHSVYIWDITSDPPRLLNHFLAHQERVTGLSLSHFDDPSIRCCTVGEDGKVKIWDAETGTLLQEHDHHFLVFNSRKPTAVHWSPVEKDLIVSGDDRGTLVFWRPSSGTIHHKHPEPAAIFCLACSPHDRDIVAVGYKNGSVIIVNIPSKSPHPLLRLRGHDEEIHCITWCPVLGDDFRWYSDQDSVTKDEEGSSVPLEAKPILLATACRDRSVRVWNITRGKPVHVMKLPTNTGHSRGSRYEEGSKSRVWVALHWPAKTPHQLISSSFNGELLIWDIGKGKPTWKSFSAGSSQKGHNRIIFNLSAGGPDGNTLCSISMDRQVIIWDIDQLCALWSLPTHGGFVYSLHLSPLQPGRLAVGAGDGLVRVWHTDNTTNPYMLQSFWQGIKGKVTSLSWHPTKEGRLAYGTDDGRVGYLDILTNRPAEISSTYHKRTVYVVTWGPICYAKDSSVTQPSGACSLYSCGDGVVLQHMLQHLDRDAVDILKIIGKNCRQGRLPNRSEISWKPDFSVVALGNEDGSIDVFSSPHLSHLASVQVHHKLVNCLRWHPAFTAESSQTSPCSAWLASGSNEAVVHVIDLTKVFERQEGEVMVVTESFCQLTGHTNRITGLSWSLHTDGLLVSVSYDWTAQVWNVRTGTPVANYRGHTGRLLTVQWSDSDDDLIYTGGEDFCLHAWRPSELSHSVPPSGKEKKKLKRKNRDQKAPVSKGISSGPVDTAVMDGAQDLGLAGNEGGASETDGGKKPVGAGARTLTYAEELAEVKAMIEQRKAQLQAAAATAVTNEGQKTVQDVVKVEKTDIEQVDDEESQSEDDHVPHQTTVFGSASLSANVPGKQSTKKEARDRRKRRARSLFPCSSVMDNRGKLQTQDDCVQLANSLYKEKEIQEDLGHLGCFINRQNTYTMLKEELDHHMKHDNSEQYLTLQLFKGDVVELLKSAAEAKQLNDHLMSIATLASPQIWRNLCVQYAEQLETDGHIHKASHYLLAACNVYEAISLFQRHNLYKEAVCLARSRLSPADPAINDAYLKWATNLTRDGNFEMAAKCFLAAREPLEAARVLAKRNEQPAVRTAVLVCLAAGEMTAAKMYGQKYIHQCLQVFDWQTAQNLVQEHDCFLAKRLAVSTHEILVRELLRLAAVEETLICDAKWTSQTDAPDCETSDKLPSLLMCMTSDSPLVPWPLHSVMGEAFIVHLVHYWSDHCGLTLTVSVIEDTCCELELIRDTRQSQSTLIQLLIDTALDVSIATLKLLLGDTELAAHYFSIAIATYHQTEPKLIGQALCRLLLPRGPDHLLKIQQHIKALRISTIHERPRKISVHDLVSTRDGDTVKAGDNITDDSINSSSDKCTAISCLQAVYYRNVVQYLLQTSNSPDGSNAAEECTRCDSTATDENSESNSKLSLARLGVGEMQELARSLLWDIQAQYYEYRESLVRIQQASVSLASSLEKNSSASRNKSSENLPSNSQLETVAEETVADEVPDKTNRRHSGEYLEMKPGNRKELRVLIPRPKPHEMLLRSPSKSSDKSLPRRTLSEISNQDDYVPMYPEDHECTQICTPQDHDNSFFVKRSFSSSSSINFCLDSPQLSVDETQNNDDSHKVTEDQDELHLPEGWRALPLDKRYTHKDMTSNFLTKEHMNIMKLISSLQLAEGCPFPNPIESALSLIQLACSLCEESVDVSKWVRPVAEWGVSHAYLEEDIHYFTTLIKNLKEDKSND